MTISMKPRARRVSPTSFTDNTANRAYAQRHSAIISTYTPNAKLHRPHRFDIPRSLVIVGDSWRASMSFLPMFLLSMVVKLSF